MTYLILMRRRNAGQCTARVRVSFDGIQPRKDADGQHESTIREAVEFMADSRYVIQAIRKEAK